MSSAAEEIPVPGDRSAEWFTRASAVTPGGVNSPVRAFGSVGGTPRFHDANISGRYQIQFLSFGQDDIYIGQPAEQLRLHRHAGAEKRNTAKALLLHRCGDGIQEADKRQRGHGCELISANLR